MALVWIPPLLRDLTGGRETADVPGATVGEIVEALERQFPGVRGRLCAGGALRSGLAVVVDGQVGRFGLREPTGPDSEVHFLPAIGGGCS
jgi:molybdopterin synthase sulfur carrier subunit